MDADSVIKRMRSRLPLKFEAAGGPVVANAVIITVDERSGKATAIRRVSF